MLIVSPQECETWKMQESISSSVGLAFVYCSTQDRNSQGVGLCAEWLRCLCGHWHISVIRQVS